MQNLDDIKLTSIFVDYVLVHFTKRLLNSRVVQYRENTVPTHCTRTYSIQEAVECTVLHL